MSWERHSEEIHVRTELGGTLVFTLAREMNLLVFSHGSNALSDQGEKGAVVSECVALFSWTCWALFHAAKLHMREAALSTDISILLAVILK